MIKSPLMYKNVAFIGSFLTLFFVLSFGVVSLAQAATITNQLDLGSKGADVTTLQTYLSSNANWYPSGLVTGYFGNLTQGGVKMFQTSEGIVSRGSPATTGYGRVGPTTMARLNTAMNSGNVQSTLYTVPVLGPISVVRGSTYATFSWMTNEPTTGQIYWDTTTIQANEATGPGQTPFVSGTLAQDPSGKQTVHTVTISGLQPNTYYYYFMRSIDASGDMSEIMPTSFQTSL